MNRHVKHIGIVFFGSQVDPSAQASSLGNHYVDAASELCDIFQFGFVDMTTSASYHRMVYHASCMIEA